MTNKNLAFVLSLLVLPIIKMTFVQCLSAGTNNKKNNNAQQQQQRQRPSLYYDDFVKDLPSLKGKTIVITGTSRGLGYVTALTVVRKGGRAILFNRPSAASLESYHQLCEEATGLSPINIDCNLLSFDSVRQACQQVCKMLTREKEEEEKDSSNADGDGDGGVGIDCLCLNAGIMMANDEASMDGYDITAQTNMLSQFLITKELFGELKKAAADPAKDEAAPSSRIVIMSSGSAYGESCLNPIFFQRQGGNMGGSKASYERYHQTKLANLLFCCSLQDKLEEARKQNNNNNILAVACTPGVCGTDMFVHATTVMFGQPSPGSDVPSVEDGSRAQLKCIFDPTVQSGDFWGPDRDGRLKKTLMEANPQLFVSDKSKQELWNVCEEAVGNFDI